jgi:hypothetical protein
MFHSYVTVYQRVRDISTNSGKPTNNNINTGYITNNKINTGIIMGIQ